MLRYLTAGESHGQALTAILDGMPAGLKLDASKINYELKRRQSGYGRGQRMKIEKDKAQIISGVRKGVSLGSPIGLLIKNKDFSIEKMPDIFCPRPGHADLAGVLKYGFKDIRNVLERASARETAIRVAVGAVCKLFLNEFRIHISSRVLLIGSECSQQAMLKKIIQAKDNFDSIGGIFEVKASNVPMGLGSYVQQDKRLDGRLSASIISIPGIKAIGFGLGFGYAHRFGSQCHDAIYYAKNKGYYRKTNNAGGIEGGISNGEDIIMHVCMKPISTLLKPLDSVDIRTKKAHKATVERTDTCVVESAAVIAEAGTAFVIASAILEKFGADALIDIKQSYKNYLKKIS